MSVSDEKIILVRLAFRRTCRCKPLFLSLLLTLSPSTFGGTVLLHHHHHHHLWQVSQSASESVGKEGKRARERLCATLQLYFLHSDLQSAVHSAQHHHHHHHHRYRSSPSIIVVVVVAGQSFFSVCLCHTNSNFFPNLNCFVQAFVQAQNALSPLFS
mgnify:CR=1 FL=1